MSQKPIKAGLSKANVNAIALAIGTATLNRLVAIFSTSVAYTKGQYTNYNNQLYRFTADKGAGAWDSSKVVSASLNDLVNDVNAAVASVTGKANVDGNYPTLTAGLAYNLDTKIVVNDVDAYNYRPTGGLDTETGNECKEKAIVGGSLGFNQLVNFDTDVSSTTWAGGSYSITGHKITVVVNAAEITISAAVVNLMFDTVANHKYLVLADGTYEDLFLYESVTTQVMRFNRITNAVNTTGKVRLNYYKPDGVAEQKTYSFYLTIFDLTAMFGSTIADYIYSLEQGHDGAGIAWFKKYFNKPYYPYTPIGGFTNVITRGKKVVGFNQFNFDKFVELYPTAVTKQDNVYTINTAATMQLFATGVPTNILPDAGLYISFEAKVGTIVNPRFKMVYEDGETAVVNFSSSVSGWQKVETALYANHGNIVAVRVDWSSTGTFQVKNFCINFRYDGERDGEYEPYREEIYENDPIELIGIPQIDNQGNLYFDGNKYLPSGVVEGNYNNKQLSGLTFELVFGTTNLFRASLSPNGLAGSDKVICTNGYRPVIYYSGPQGVIENDKTIYIGGDNNLYIHDSDYDNADDFQSAINSHNVIYPLATPTTSQAKSYPETQWLDNWGTEERLPPDNDTRPCEVPVGHDTNYPLDLKSKLEIMANSPSQDGDYVLHSASGVNTYVPLGAWLSSNGWVKLTDISGYDATKIQSMKNVNGTLTWVTEGE